MLYKDRAEAGRILASKLGKYADRGDVLVLALPRGGVPVAFEVARALHAPLELLLVRKLGAPGHPELAFGATASGGVVVLNEEVIQELRISRQAIDAIIAREREELLRCEQSYRSDQSALVVERQIVILIDDGLATGSSMRAALTALRHQHPARLVVAVPVGAPDTCDDFLHEADEAICVRTPDPFYSVGTWYEDFSQTTDEEVRELLDRALQFRHAAIASGAAPHGSRT